MQKKRWYHGILILLLAIMVLSGCQNAERIVTENLSSQQKFEVHFIDVGQGDSILVQSGDETLLIDAGENNMGERVVSYLESLGIEELDYVIGTHPHSDHIGGLDVVIDGRKVNQVILPVVEHTTKTYEDVLIAISNQGLKITKPVVGKEYTLGDASFQIIAPNSDDYEDLNDYSVGIRLVYGDTSYVFAGDADVVSEEEMCDNGFNLSADVLKLNHHGSRYSNNKEFVDAVNPTYAVISVGEGNSYGHPHAEVLEDMKQRGITVYRTDLAGTIVLTSDGKNIEFNSKGIQDTDQEDFKVDETKQSYVYVTESGTKYHKEGCSYRKGKIQNLTLDEAVQEGYTACSRCYQ